MFDKSITWVKGNLGKLSYTQRMPTSAFDPYKDVIRREYAKHGMKHVKRHMKSHYDFDAKTSQYAYRLKLWKEEDAGTSNVQATPDYGDAGRRQLREAPGLPMDDSQQQTPQFLPTIVSGRPLSVELESNINSSSAFAPDQGIDAAFEGVEGRNASSLVVDPVSEGPAAPDVVKGPAKRPISTSLETSNSSRKRHNDGVLLGLSQESDFLSMSPELNTANHSRYNPRRFGYIHPLPQEEERGAMQELKPMQDTYEFEKENEIGYRRPPLLLRTGYAPTASSIIPFFRQVDQGMRKLYTTIESLSDSSDYPWKDISRKRAAAEICFAASDFRNAFFLHFGVLCLLQELDSNGHGQNNVVAALLRRQVVACSRAAVNMQDSISAGFILESCLRASPSDSMAPRDLADRFLLHMLLAMISHRKNILDRKKLQLLNASNLLPSYDHLVTEGFHHIMQTDLVMFRHMLNAHAFRLEKSFRFSLTQQKRDSEVDQIRATFASHCINSSKIDTVKQTILWCRTQLCNSGQDHFNTIASSATAPSHNAPQKASFSHELSCFLWRQWILQGVETPNTGSKMTYLYTSDFRWTADTANSMGIAGAELLYVLAACAMKQTSIGNSGEDFEGVCRVAIQGMDSLLKLSDAALIEEVLEVFLRREKSRNDLKETISLPLSAQQSIATFVKQELDIDLSNDGLEFPGQDHLIEPTRPRASSGTELKLKIDPPVEPAWIDYDYTDAQERNSQIPTSNPTIYLETTPISEDKYGHTLSIPNMSESIHCRTPSANSVISDDFAHWLDVSPERRSMQQTKKDIENARKLSARNSVSLLATGLIPEDQPSDFNGSVLFDLSSSMGSLNLHGENSTRRSSTRLSAQQLLEKNRELDEQAVMTCDSCEMVFKCNTVS